MLLVMENVLGADEVQEFRAALAEAPWIDGRASAGTLSVSVKDNLQLDDRSGVAQRLGNRILSLLGRHPLFISAALPNRFFPPRFNRYAGGGHYGAHVDGALMYSDALPQAVRSDLSAQRALLFDLDQSIQSLSGGRDPADPDLLRLTGVYHNLLRAWAET